MKKVWAIGSIVAVHGVMVGALMLSGGCGTTKQAPPAEVPVVVMPPVEPPVVMPPPAPKMDLPPARELSTKTYKVKSGDSLSVIAKRFNVSRADLMKLNKISDPNKVRIGQKLTLPGYVNLNAPEPVRKARKAAPAAVAGGSSYTVVSGDSLGGIAYRHKTTVKAIKQVNSMTSDRISIGQKLAMPKGTAAVSAPEVAATEGSPAPVDEMAVAPVVGASDAVAPVVAPKSNEVLHVVEPNQDLNSIAMMYGVRAEEIIRLNSLTSPDVRVGQTIKIPPPVE